MLGNRQQATGNRQLATCGRTTIYDVAADRRMLFAVVVDDDDDSKDASSAKQATVSAQLLIFEPYEWPNPNRAWPELDPGLAWLASILYILSPPLHPSAKLFSCTAFCILLA